MAHHVISTAGAAPRDPEALAEFLRALCAVAPDGVIISDGTGTVRVVSDRAAAMFGYTREEIVGQSIEMLVPPRSRDLHGDLRHGYLDDPVPRLMGEARDLYGMRKDGTYLPVDISLSALDSEDGLLVVSMVRDMTPRLRLLDQLRREQGQLRGANAAARAILAGEHVDEVVRIVVSGARQIAAARYGVLLVAGLGPESGHMHVRVADADAADLDGLVRLRIPLGETLIGDAVANGRSLLLENVGRAPWSDVLVDGIGPAIVVPVPSARADTALLAVANPVGSRLFSRHDLGAVESAATQAAVALDFAAMRDDLRHLAVSEERDRIAMDLHDGIIQELFGTAMALQSAAARVDDQPDAVRAGLDEAATRIDSAISDLRGYIYDLAEERRDPSRLDATLRSIASLVRQQSGLVVVVDIDAAAAAAVSAHAEHLQHVAREALSNAARHADATTCRLKLRFDAARDAVVLEIDDDGHGFDTESEAIWGSGHGLGNMRKRATEAGATLDVESGPDTGTTVRVRLPLG
ncbi:MAG: PAS domain S-box protein [Acidimicrobiia bacterium]|nr:PAS domain S-box protein [Acidimicrobiia bacterium]